MVFLSYAWVQQQSINLDPGEGGTFPTYIMRYVYLLETKTFYTSSEGIDFQTADMGDTPWIYSSYKTASMMLDKRVKYYQDIYGYGEAREWDTDEIGIGHTGRRVECRKEIEGTRVVFSIYKECILTF